jgi:aminoglycoside 6'-N-acetyltransferase
MRGGGHALIAVDGTPVGYICWQPYRREDLETVGESDIAEGSIDVDLMIGELAHVGKGVGPCALQILLEQLAEDASVPLVGVCTSVENTRAIRAFEKAGFSRLREYDDPELGRCWFMVARTR